MLLWEQEGKKWPIGKYRCLSYGFLEWTRPAFHLYLSVICGLIMGVECLQISPLGVCKSFFPDKQLVFNFTCPSV